MLTGLRILVPSDSFPTMTQPGKSRALALLQYQRRQGALIEIETIQHIICLGVTVGERRQTKAFLYELQD